MTNGHVARMARETGASLVLNTDAHLCDDLVCDATARKIAAGAGLTAAEISRMFSNSEELAKRAFSAC